MEVMEDKDKHMVTESTNRKKLLEEVEALVVSFSCLLDTTLSVCLFPFPFRQSKKYQGSRQVRIDPRCVFQGAVHVRSSSILLYPGPISQKNLQALSVKLLLQENMTGLVLTSELVDEMLWCDNLNETSLVVLVLYYMQC